MPSAGIDWHSPSRTFRNLFGRYGITGGSIRGLYSGLLPVVVADRYRDDTEGSLFGITLYAEVIAGAYAAFALGSADDDWEIHHANLGTYVWTTPAVNMVRNFMVYTPDFTYVPVSIPAPAGLWEPGLNTNFPFTLSSVRGVAGYNAGVPSRFGHFPFRSISQTTSPFFTYNSTFFLETQVHFDPPIRVYRDVTLGFLCVESNPLPFDAMLSLLYTVRPRTTEGPRTG